jgi:hypothetical protein
LISVLNRAARDTGIIEVLTTSAANECLRRINLDAILPIDRWGSFPSRSDGPDADMRNTSGSSDRWQVLNRSTGIWQYRNGKSNDGPSYRTGTERHDTGLALDCYLKASINGRETVLLPTVNAHRIRIIEFLTAFASYGGRAVGVGSSSSRTMPNGCFHLDMLGAGFGDRAAIRPTGFRGTVVMGWNRNQLTAWGYGGASYTWALQAMQQGFRR